MKYEIRVTNAAATDLENTYNYIADYFGDEVATESVQKIILAYKSLEDFPEKGVAANERLPIVSADQYFLTTKHNTVYYRFNDEFITILRIFNNREDFTAKILDQGK